MLTTRTHRLKDLLMSLCNGHWSRRKARNSTLKPSYDVGITVISWDRGYWIGTKSIPGETATSYQAWFSGHWCSKISIKSGNCPQNVIVWLKCSHGCMCTSQSWVTTGHKFRRNVFGKLHFNFAWKFWPTFTGAHRWFTCAQYATTRRNLGYLLGAIWERLTAYFAKNKTGREKSAL